MFDDSADGVLVGIVWAGCDALAGMGLTAASDMYHVEYITPIAAVVESITDVTGYELGG